MRLAAVTVFVALVILIAAAIQTVLNNRAHRQHTAATVEATCKRYLVADTIREL